MSQAISGALRFAYENSLSNYFLQDTRLYPDSRYDRETAQSSLIDFRNGREDSGFLERCGRSLIVEPVFLVVSLGALVETVVRVVLTIVAIIVSYFRSTQSEEDESTDPIWKKPLEAAAFSLCGLITSTGWIAKNIFAKELHYTNDLNVAVKVVKRPFQMLANGLECTGLNEVIRNMACGVCDD